MEDINCEQCVADNVDINIRSLYGNTSFHAMGRIKIVTPAPNTSEGNRTFSRMKVSTEEKRELLRKLELKLIPFHPKVINSLSLVKFIPLSELQNKLSYIQSTIGNTVRLAGWIINMNKTYFLY